jgi:hypothetical protein
VNREEFAQVKQDCNYEVRVFVIDLTQVLVALLVDRHAHEESKACENVLILALLLQTNKQHEHHCPFLSKAMVSIINHIPLACP